MSRRSPQRSDDEIVKLVREHQAGLRAHLRALCCPEAHIDDLLQDSFLRFLARDIEDRGLQATASYLRKIARSSYFKALAQQRRRREVFDLDAAEQAWTQYEGTDNGESYRQALDDCLASLGERSRRSLILRYQEEMGRNEIGMELGLNESGVKSILQRSRRFLRDCIERRMRT